MTTDKNMKTSIFILVSSLAIILQAYAPTVVHADTQIPVQPFFRDIKEVGLYVKEPSLYETALKCHGIEEQCADENVALKIHPERRMAYIEELVEKYQDYPEPLRMESLQGSVSKHLKAELRPFITSDKKEPIILSDDNVEEFAEREGALVIIVTMRVVDDTNPHITILDIRYFRPEVDYKDFRSQAYLGRVTAIPLNSSKEKIAELTREFLRGIQIRSQREFE